MTTIHKCPERFNINPVYPDNPVNPVQINRLPWLRNAKRNNRMRTIQKCPKRHHKNPVYPDYPVNPVQTSY